MPECAGTSRIALLRQELRAMSFQRRWNPQGLGSAKVIHGATIYLQARAQEWQCTTAGRTASAHAGWQERLAAPCAARQDGQRGLVCVGSSDREGRGMAWTRACKRVQGVPARAADCCARSADRRWRRRRPCPPPQPDVRHSTTNKNRTQQSFIHQPEVLDRGTIQPACLTASTAVHTSRGSAAASKHSRAQCSLSAARAPWNTAEGALHWRYGSCMLW